MTAADIRCEMVAAAIAGIPYFEMDRREADRTGPTYTWDTIESFNGGATVLILGADAAAGLRTWHRGDELAEKIAIAVVGRPGTSRADVEEAVPSARWLEMPELDLSSTELRAWLARGFTGRFLIPDPVTDVIVARGLYSDRTQR